MKKKLYGLPGSPVMLFCYRYFFRGGFLDGVPGLIGGVGGSSAATIVFPAWACVDRRDYPCRLQADFVSHERLLERDVLNRLDVLFRGPAAEVVINP